MNQKIRELAEQAGEYANSVYTPPVRSKTPGKIWEDGHIDWYELYNEKFAELIVKECIDRLRTEGELGKIQAIAGPSGIYKLSFMNEAANIIEEHFGVE